MVFLEEAGLLADIEAIGFQFKDGAAFHKQAWIRPSTFPTRARRVRPRRFRCVATLSHETLANGAAAYGAHIVFGEEVIAFE